MGSFRLIAEFCIFTKNSIS